jgi:hypothetical protein
MNNNISANLAGDGNGRKTYYQPLMSNYFLRNLDKTSILSATSAKDCLQSHNTKPL